MTKIILIFCDYYLPGYKAGGPIQSIANIVEGLGDEYSIKIVTRNHDVGDRKPYNSIEVGRWQQVGKASVFYLSLKRNYIGQIRQLLNKIPHDVVYLNSFFSPYFTLSSMILRKFHAVPLTPLILAPRGEFSEGHLFLNKKKYLTYIFLSKIVGFYKNIGWHASTDMEKAEIMRWIDEQAKISVAPNLPAKPPAKYSGSIKKIKGEIRIVFISRIVKKKNLFFFLETVKNLQGKVKITICGSIEDKRYWDKCQKIIVRISKRDNIKIEYIGDVPHSEVNTLLSSHHVFFFPTLGENFGHVIFEAWSAGIPVIISDQTPWQNLSPKDIGWDIPLNQPDRFVKVLQDIINMKNDEYEKMSRNAWKFAYDFYHSDFLWRRNRELFAKAVYQNEPES